MAIHCLPGRQQPAPLLVQQQQLSASWVSARPSGLLCPFCRQQVPAGVLHRPDLDPRWPELMSL
jgi:hypothetical protein